MRTLITHALTVFMLIASQWVWAQPKSYPDDPFKWERRPVNFREIGTAVGQLRLSALGGFVVSGNSDKQYLVGQLSSETIFHEFVGVRFSGIQELQDQGDGRDYKFSSIRFGPAYHYRPYRKIDIGSFLEGGAVIVDLYSGGSDSAPEVALGGFITYYLNSYVFIQMELQRSWANMDIDGVQGSHNRTLSIAGFGVAF